MCWRGDLLLSSTACWVVRRLWTRNRIESRNRFCVSKKFVSICSWWWIGSSRGVAFGPESNRLWVVVWLRTLGQDISSKDSMVSELWLRAAVEFRCGWDSGMGTLRASPCSGHWIHAIILTGVKFWPLQHYIERDHRSCSHSTHPYSTLNGRNRPQFPFH